MDSTATQYDMSDLVRYAYEGQPAKMQDVFNELMVGRVYDSIQQKKIEVANRFFSPDEQKVDSDTEKEDENGEDSK